MKTIINKICITALVLGSSWLYSDTFTSTWGQLLGIKNNTQQTFKYWLAIPGPERTKELAESSALANNWYKLVGAPNYPYITNGLTLENNKIFNEAGAKIYFLHDDEKFTGIMATIKEKSLKTYVKKTDQKTGEPSLEEKTELILAGQHLSRFTLYFKKALAAISEYIKKQYIENETIDEQGRWNIARSPLNEETRWSIELRINDSNQDAEGKMQPLLEVTKFLLAPTVHYEFPIEIPLTVLTQPFNNETPALEVK